MFEGLKQWHEARTLRKQATRLVDAREGFAGKDWPLTPAMSEAGNGGKRWKKVSSTCCA